MAIRPGFCLIGTIFLIIVYSFFGCVYADELSSGSHEESPWAGTWVDTNYSLSLSQDGSVISGIAIVSNPDIQNMPFILTGTLSEDGKTLQCLVNQSGNMTMNLSEDKMMFIADETIDSLDPHIKPYSNTFNATRNATPIIPGQDWTGTWTSKKCIINLTQTNTTVRGDYHFFITLLYGGLLEGTTSTDGKTLSMRIVSPVKTSFTLSDDGKNIIEGECTAEKIAVNGYCLNLTKKE